VIGGGLTGSPTQSRIARTVGASVIKAMIRSLSTAVRAGQWKGFEDAREQHGPDGVSR
jgi:hypothetical protein